MHLKADDAIVEISKGKEALFCQVGYPGGAKDAVKVAIIGWIDHAVSSERAGTRQFHMHIDSIGLPTMREAMLMDAMDALKAERNRLAEQVGILERHIYQLGGKP
jgi:hypothetical protein